MSKNSKQEKFIDVSKLTETDKLLMKLDSIIISIRGKEGPINYKSIKDQFDKKRFQVNEKLKEAETLLNERDRLINSTSPKDIYQRKNIERKVEDLLDAMESQLKDLGNELERQKNKKGKYGNFTNKDNMLKLMNDKYHLLRSILDGMEVDEKHFEDNRKNMELIDEIIKKQEGRNVEEREIYEEEQKKIDEWNEELERQDEDLNELGMNVKMLKNEVKIASDNIDNVGKSVKKVTKRTEQTTSRLVGQNKKLKDLLNKIRSSDKICVDILLVLLLLGLCAVLFSILKRKFF